MNEISIIVKWKYGLNYSKRNYCYIVVYLLVFMIKKMINLNNYYFMY